MGKHILQGRRQRADNTSGVAGVQLESAGGRYKTDRWMARIGVRGTTVQIGRFHDKNDAIKARIAGEAILAEHGHLPLEDVKEKLLRIKPHGKSGRPVLR